MQIVYSIRDRFRWQEIATLQAKNKILNSFLVKANNYKRTYYKTIFCLVWISVLIVFISVEF